MDSEKIQQTDYSQKNYNRGGRAFGGLVIVALGVLWLIHRMHLVFFPTWLFTWPMFLVALGLFIGARKGFYGGGWLTLIIIGGVFLIPRVYWYYTGLSISGYTWPIVIIAIGLYMILRPKRDFRNSMRFKGKWGHHNWADNTSYSGLAAGQTTGDDYLDETSIFGGVNKVVVSKNFKGGDIVNIFGGCDINLTQADFKGTVTIDFVQIFGGAKIIVPTDWKVVVKTTSIFGGVEDKRPPSLIKENPDKTLVIDGTSIFAGISIQCY
jgi:predicted membrane protein